MEIMKEKHQLLSESEKSKASPAIEFEIGKRVKIKEIDQESKQEMEPEDYFYLKGFEKKIGVISEQRQSVSGAFTYKVEFNEKHFGYFYSKDLMLIPQNNYKS
ncbi:hypothetical protein V7266_26080 [Neobacillus drentensis]|uniref:hypothetical protein n=1 Tax=Neobacillus drentensis TaxID=220684 RepID=UPI002FFD921D